MTDIPVCEWGRPGSNRSTISIEVAAQRVHPADRAQLIEAFNARQFSDRVRVYRDRIESETIGTYTYAATVRNMNFANGRLCNSVTRKTWAVQDWQGAMVFNINGRFYGYAAVCGNLFELDGALEEHPPASDERVPSISLATAPPETFEPPPADADTPEDIEYSGRGTAPSYPSFFIGGSYSVVTLECQSYGTPPIPEPREWASIGAGLVLLYIWRRKRRKRRVP